MSIQIHINGENAAEAIRELSVLASHLSPSNVAAPAATTPTTKAETSTRGRSNSKPVADPVKENKDPDPVIEDSDTTEGGGDDEYVPTVVELRAKASEVGKTAEAKKAIKALLDEGGFKSISDVSEGNRAAFMKELEAI